MTHEELGPRPLAKIDLQKLDNDVMQLTEQAASTGELDNCLNQLLQANTFRLSDPGETGPTAK